MRRFYFFNKIKILTPLFSSFTVKKYLIVPSIFSVRLGSVLARTTVA